MLFTVSFKLHLFVFFPDSLPGVKKALDQYGPAGTPAAAAEEDDDDIDLFGSDDEEADEAAEKLKEERLAAYAAKKAKSK